MNPEITEHFPFITVKRHPVLPGFRDITILFQDMRSQKLQTAFHRFFFLQELIQALDLVQ
jgi:hypothetical protein